MALGMMELALTSVSDLRSDTGRVSAAKTCCVKASKANDKMVKREPKEAKYLLIVSNAGFV